VRLTISLQVRAKYFGCVVCRFHVAAGAEATPQTFSRRRQHFQVPLQKSANNNLRKWFLFPTGRLNFGFITEGKLTVVLITPYSWGSQLVYAPAASPSPPQNRLRSPARRPPSMATAGELRGSKSRRPLHRRRPDLPATSSGGDERRGGGGGDRRQQRLGFQPLRRSREVMQERLHLDFFSWFGRCLSTKLEPPLFTFVH
jgi:hypothetical protein